MPNLPKTTVLDTAGVEDDVANVLEKDYGERAVNVNCPSDEQAVVGRVYTCTVSVGGQTKHVQITVRTTSGTFEVGAPR